jgi:hypothetical protein
MGDQLMVRHVTKYCRRLHPLYHPIHPWALRADLDLPIAIMYGGRPEFRDARYTTPVQ